MRVKATIRRKELWQLREISGGSGFGQTTPLGHFGLGDAAVAETVLIEWPSGAVSEFHQVKADQLLIGVEPPKLEDVRFADGAFAANVVGLVGSKYWVEGSSNLTEWKPLLAVTNSSRRTAVNIPGAPVFPQQFFRLRVP